MKRIANSTGVAFALLAVAISSAFASAPITSGPYTVNPTPTSDHSLGLKRVLFIRTQFPDLATSKTQADCQTVMEQVMTETQLVERPRSTERVAKGVASKTPFLITRNAPDCEQTNIRPSGAIAIAVGEAIPLATVVSIKPDGSVAAETEKDREYNRNTIGMNNRA